jgi:hypothetical protein
VVQKYGLLSLVSNAFFDYVANCQVGVIVVMMMMVIIIIIIIIMLNGYIALSDCNLLISIYGVMQETLT